MAENPISVQVVTGGHPFVADAFFAVFDSIDNITWTAADTPSTGYDVVVFYDMPGLKFTGGNPPVDLPAPTTEHIKVLNDLQDAGTGLVFMHHALASWPTWEGFADLVGGRFHYQPATLRGMSYPDSGYVFDVEHTIEIIDSGQYSLYPDYSQLFSVAAENNSETIFDVEYTGLEGGSYGCLICLEGNAAVGFQGIRQYNGPVYGDGNSYNLPTQELYDAFSSLDLRRGATILDIDAFIATQPNPSSISYAIGAGGHSGYYNNKYIKRQGEIGLPDNDLTSPVNYRVIRYADVLLMAAEAHYQSGNTATAQSLVTQVRLRVGVQPIPVNSLDVIYRERRYELSGEGHRFFDLVRTGKAADFINGFVVGKHEVFPIPQVEIDLAGGNWPQNNGY